MAGRRNEYERATATRSDQGRLPGGADDPRRRLQGSQKSNRDFRDEHVIGRWSGAVGHDCPRAAVELRAGGDDRRLPGFTAARSGEPVRRHFPRMECRCCPARPRNQSRQQPPVERQLPAHRTGSLDSGELGSRFRQPLSRLRQRHARDHGQPGAHGVRSR